MLDACVLYPLPLRDTLLRLAQRRLFAVRWSGRILDEVTRNLIADHRATSEQAQRLVDAMRQVFPGSEVPVAAIGVVEPAMTNEPSDRHVLATVVASEDAKALVTFNLRHFPAAVCEPLGVDVLHPDLFLCELYGQGPQSVHAVLAEQVAMLSRPPMTVDDVLERLGATVPEFVGRVRGSRHPA